MNYIELSAESRELNEVLRRMGYSPEFSLLIAMQLRTTWTANRMLGYLRNTDYMPEEEIVDEMLSILSHRDQIRQKKEAEYYQQKINELYYYGLERVED